MAKAKLRPTGGHGGLMVFRCDIGTNAKNHQGANFVTEGYKRSFVEDWLRSKADVQECTRTSLNAFIKISWDPV